MAYLANAINDYIQPTPMDSPFKENYLKLMNEHCEWLARPNGIFYDDKVIDGEFQGGLRRIRMVIYRQIQPKMTISRGRTLIDDLGQIATRIQSKLKGVNIQCERLSGNAFREWLIRWFNPRPKNAKGSTDKLLENLAKDASIAERPFAYDFAEHLFFSVPKSDDDTGTWYFDDLPHRYIAIQNLSRVPELGQLTRERQFSQYHYGLFDKFPEGASFVMTVVLTSQEDIKNHLEKIEETARKSRSTAASLTFEDCQIAKTAIEKGNYLFPTTMGVYLRGETLDHLNDKETALEGILVNNGFQVLNQDHELLPLHSYLHQLPFCYNYQFDKQYLYRSNYIFAKQLANLLPLYGRERGTGHPLFQFLNRGGESFSIDPLNPEDKDQNSHLLFLGSTGSGKSATSTDLLIKLMGTYKPYLVMVDAGDSFVLLKDYFKEQGLSVHHVAIKLNDPPILNPFVDSEKMLAQLDNKTQLTPHELAKLESKQQQENDEPEEKVTRDIMGEMALSCQLMITGGEQKETENLTRQDRMLILDALVRAANQAKQEGFNQMLPQDVVTAFRQMAGDLAGSNQELEKVARLRTMADSMDFFCKDSIANKVFNRRGEPWPDADVTLFEQGLFKDEGYEAHNALAFMGLMARTMAKAEQRQFEERCTVVFGDEIHTITKNILTVIYLTKCAKMSRKFGLWLWLATQNIADFPKEAKKILSMIEFWICLGMSEAEMQSIEQFRKLSDEERMLFRSVRKSAKKYVEGVLLCSRVKALFRNVPPRLSLALAMTEKHEKAERRKLMDDQGISQLDAAREIARKMLCP